MVGNLFGETFFILQFIFLADFAELLDFGEISRAGVAKQAQHICAAKSTVVYLQLRQDASFLIINTAQLPATLKFYWRSSAP